MNRIAMSLALSATALTLVACGGKDGAANTKTGSEAAAPAASATTMPLRKSGYWQQTMTAAGSKPVTMSMCLDAATAATMSAMGSQTSASQCSENSFQRGLDGKMTFHSTCNLGTGGIVKSSGEITGDFNSEYTMNIQSETTGAAVPQMNRATTMTMTAKWTGECPPDVKPGDMVMPGGMKINMTTGAGAPPPPK